MWLEDGPNVKWRRTGSYKLDLMLDRAPPSADALHARGCHSWVHLRSDDTPSDGGPRCRHPPANHKVRRAQIVRGIPGPTRISYNMSAHGERLACQSISHTDPRVLSQSSAASTPARPCSSTVLPHLPARTDHDRRYGYVPTEVRAPPPMTTIVC